MTAGTVLRVAAILSAGWATVALALLLARAWSFGRRPMYARATGSASAGVRNAFFKGMLPWSKESVSEHLPTFLAGLGYHAGIFTGLLYLVVVLSGADLSVPIRLALRALLVAGLICGLALFVKRISLAKMWVISSVDDFVANLLADLFLLTALVATLGAPFEPIFLLASVALFIYIPLGKIRHCVFFFYTRILFGISLGRRGVLPPRYGQTAGN